MNQNFDQINIFNEINKFKKKSAKQFIETKVSKSKKNQDKTISH